MTGRIDVHSHLLPAVDDGCSTVEESLACARLLVEAGYTHSFVTPHVMEKPIIQRPDRQTVATIRQWTDSLQEKLNQANIPLTLLPGGEINLWPKLTEELTEDRISTFGGFGRYCLVDIWADKLPDFFAPTIQWLQARRLKVVLAHPERMKAVQIDPDLADYFTELGLVLQGNLQCLSDPPGSATRVTAEKFLTEGRYFLLGSDLHHLDSLPARLAGLRNAIELVGPDDVDRLTIHHPTLLLNG